MVDAASSEARRTSCRRLREIIISNNLMCLYERPLLHIHKLADGNAEIMGCGELGEGLFFSYTLFYMNLHLVPQAERISQTKLQLLKLTTTLSSVSTEECKQGY